MNFKKSVVECNLANNNDRYGGCDNEKKLWYILIEKKLD